MMTRAFIFLLPLVAPLANAAALPSSDIKQNSHALAPRGQNMLVDAQDATTFDWCDRYDGYYCCFKNGVKRCFLQASGNNGKDYCRFIPKEGIWRCLNTQEHDTRPPSTLDTDDIHAEDTCGFNYVKQKWCCYGPGRETCKTVQFLPSADDNGITPKGCWRQGRQTCCTGYFPPPVCYLTESELTKDVSPQNLQEIDTNTCYRSRNQICCRVAGRMTCHPTADLPAATEVDENTILCYAKGFQTCCLVKGRWVCRRRNVEDEESTPDTALTNGVCQTMGRKFCCWVNGAWKCQPYAASADVASVDTIETVGICQTMGRKFCCWVNGAWKCQPYALKTDDASVDAIEIEGICQTMGRKFCCWVNGAWKCQPYASQDLELSSNDFHATKCFGEGGRICCLYGSEWRCKNAGWLASNSQEDMHSNVFLELNDAGDSTETKGGLQVILAWLGRLHFW